MITNRYQKSASNVFSVLFQSNYYKKNKINTTKTTQKIKIRSVEIISKNEYFCVISVRCDGSWQQFCDRRCFLIKLDIREYHIIEIIQKNVVSEHFTSTNSTSTFFKIVFSRNFQMSKFSRFTIPNELGRTLL